MLGEALVDGHAVWVVDARQLDEAVTKRFGEGHLVELADTAI